MIICSISVIRMLADKCPVQNLSSQNKNYSPLTLCKGMQPVTEVPTQLSEIKQSNGIQNGNK